MTDWRLLVLLIRAIADIKGLTHQEIGEMAGISRQHVTRVFSIKYRPRLDILLILTNVIGIDLSIACDDVDLNTAIEIAQNELTEIINKE